MIVLRKLTRIRWGDQMDIARAYVYLLCAGWRVFVRRQRLDRWLGNQQATEKPEPMAAWEQRTVDRAVCWTNRAARYPLPWARCLQRSIALCSWLEHHGIYPELRIGVRKNGNEIDAHAWVQYKGQILNDVSSVDETFAVLEPTRDTKMKSGNGPGAIES